MYNLRMATRATSAARAELPELVSRAKYRRERTVIARHGKPLAALVPSDELRAPEHLEEELDVREARKALARGAEPLRYEDVRRELAARSSSREKGKGKPASPASPAVKAKAGLRNA